MIRKQMKGRNNTFIAFEMSELEFLGINYENGGLCIRCGDEAHGVEPDARKYECEGCGERGVYGCEELLIMGIVTISEEVTK